MLLKLINPQRIDGSWVDAVEPLAVLQELHDHADAKEQPALKALLTASQALLTKAPSINADASFVVVTILALAVLEIAFKDARAQWQLLAAKGRSFVRAKCKADPLAKFAAEAASHMGVSI